MTKLRKSVFWAVTAAISALAIIYFVRTSPAQTATQNFAGATIRGRVVSTYGPVEKARVRVAGEEHFVLSDHQGWFALPTNYLSGRKVKLTAGKKGWFNNGQIVFITGGRVRDIFLYPVYHDDRPGYQFISPAYCARCHTKVTRYWDQSKMAHSTSNPLLLDMYYGTDASKRPGIGPGFKLDNPASEGNCTICHAPSVAAGILRSQDLYSALQPSQSEWDGISCEYCHKIRDVLPDSSKPSGTAALLERQSAANSPSILVFGPYDDTVVPPMAASYNPVLSEGRFCSLCHAHFKKLPPGTAWNPDEIYTVSEWAAFGMADNTYLPIQTTFQEWKQWQDQLPASDSNKGKKCQDCHLSWQKRMLPYDNYVVDGHARDMWGTHRSEQNIRPHHFEGGTETQLKTSLSMELEGTIRNRKLEIKAYITNTNGGHWIPTGETMRSVMLLMQAKDSNGNALKMTRGDRLPDWTGKGNINDGNYAGLPGVVFARILADDQGNLHVPFWQATRIVADNRIRPKDSVVLKFEFAITDPDDEPRVEAKLIYRPVIKPLAKVKNWSVKDILITSSAW